MNAPIESQSRTVRSLSIEDGAGIDVFDLLGAISDGNGRLTELQLAFDTQPDVVDLALLANRAFDSNLLPFQVHRGGSFEDCDHLIARTAFGAVYQIVPYFARLKSRKDPRFDEQTIEAWTSPILVPADHFLAQKIQRPAVRIFRQPPGMNDHKSSSTMATLDFFDRETPVQYLRLTLSPSFHSLDEACQAFGAQGVNIYEVRQPENE